MGRGHLDKKINQILIKMEDAEVLGIIEKKLKRNLLFDERFKSLILTRETRIREDLHLDFLDCYMLSCWLELEDKVKIREELDNFRVIGEYVDYIKPQLEKRRIKTSNYQI